jgi:eukaryotic-like serine/threonine-protein kinase
MMKGRQESTDYLVMEYLEGETLAERLGRGAMPHNVAIETAMGILDGLAEAHRNGIVHRDLKPANIMLTRSGVKLMDFGLAKSFPTTDPVDDSATELMGSPVTAQGSIVGTLEYMAPEQLEDRPATGRSDIFSFGAVLYEMVTGRRAFSGNTRVSVIAAVLMSEPPSLAEVQPMTTLSLDRLLRSCLAKNPESRWSSINDPRIQLDWIGKIWINRKRPDCGGEIGSGRRLHPVWFCSSPALSGPHASALPRPQHPRTRCTS